MLYLMAFIAGCFALNQSDMPIRGKIWTFVGLGVLAVALTTVFS